MSPRTKHLTPDSVPVPDDRDNNFWYVRTESDVVIVFVHGIFSSSHSCWLYKGPMAKKAVFWPDLVREDKRLGGPSIYMAGYYTAVDAGDFPITQCARQVLEALQREDPDGTPPVLDAPSIVFVCHSTGGIVARYFLERYKSLFRDKAVGLALIASPSLGSNWANVGSIAARYYNQQLGLQLRWSGGALGDLHGRFGDLVYDRHREMPGLFGMEAAENKMVFRDSMPAMLRWMLPNRLRVVSSLSAAQYFKEVTVLRNTDHFSTVKPYGVSHPAHEFLVTFMTRFRDPSSDHQQNAARVRERQTPVSNASGPGGSQHWGLGTGSASTGAGAALGAPGVLSTPSVAQSTQLFISYPAQASLDPGIGSQLTRRGFPLPLPAFHAALLREAPPKPRIEELFEIITDPDDVPKALFRTDPASGLAPYDVEYVNARNKVPDTQDALAMALLESKGRMLVTGLRGIGKTREVAELARAACAASWKVLVARDEANGRIGPPADLPGELVDARVMLIIDNLHTRVIAGADQQTSYVDRLELLLEWLERRLPGSLRVVATARDEPRFQAQLDLRREAKRWRSFGVFPLPMISDDGLRRILTALAARANVAVVADDIPKLIENSDRKPETLFINVDLARHNRTALNQRAWRPTEGESWRLRFVRARAEHAGVDRICQVLHLLNEAGLPARIEYVTYIARESGDPEADAAVNALVGEGLLGMRQEVLTPFSVDQLKELVGEHGIPALRLLASVEIIERAITDAAKRPPECIDDLLALSQGVSQAGDADRAERVATRVIELGADGARAHRVRAGIRFQRRDFVGVEGDLTAAINVGGDDKDTRFLRGVVRNLLANFSGALDDLDAAAKQGRDDGILHAQRGTSYYQLNQLRDAEGALSTAIDRGHDEGMIFFMRAIARFLLQDDGGADQDFSAALERGIDLDEVGRQLRTLGAPEAARPAGEATGPSVTGGLMIHALRGVARFRLGKHKEADEDLSAAIAGRVGDRFKVFSESVQESNLPMIARASKDLEQARLSFGEAPLFHLRGLTRLSQARFSEAEADFDSAIAGGFDDAGVYYGRGWARLEMKRPAEAERDASTAIEKSKQDGPPHALRGLARVALQKITEAEQDLEKAVELGAGNANILTALGAVLLQLQKPAEAEAEFTAALALTPHARARFLRGCVRFDFTRFAEAEQDLTAALELGFDQAALFTIRGMARLVQEDFAGAEQDVIAAFERGANDVHAYSLRAGVRLHQERYKEAEEDLSAASALGRNDLWLLFHRGRSRQAIGRFAEAELDFDGIAAPGVAHGDVLVRRGQARLSQEKHKEAADDFVAAIAAGRDDAFVHFLLAGTHQEQRQYDDAEREFTLAIARDGQPIIRMPRATLRLIRGDFRRAEEDLAEVIAAMPTDANALYQRGFARFGQGHTAGALADWDAALAVSPTETAFLGSRAMGNLRLDRIEKAAQDCAQLESIDPNGSETLGTLGTLQLARGDVDGAAKRFTAAAAGERTWYCWLGLVHLMTGRLDEARQAYKDGTAEALPADVLIAINQLDWQMSERAERTIARDARATASLIRGELVKLVGAQSSGGVAEKNVGASKISESTALVGDGRG